jgi:hypothetical protein
MALTIPGDGHADTLLDEGDEKKMDKKMPTQ